MGKLPAKRPESKAANTLVRKKGEKGINAWEWRASQARGGKAT